MRPKHQKRMEKLKLLFSLMFMSTTCFGSILNIYSPLEKKESAVEVKQYLVQKYGIPEKLIKISLEESCEVRDARFIELCINKKGELKELSNQNIKKIIKSLLVFKAEA